LELVANDIRDEGGTGQKGGDKPAKAGFANPLCFAFRVED
jgi:hypothetical protein